MGSIVIGLALASVALEGTIAWFLPWLRRINANHRLFNAAFSLGLSYVLGFAFGAAGMIVLFAGILSTLLSFPMYAMLEWNFANDNVIAQWRAKNWSRIVRTWSDLGKLLWWCIRIITLPVRIISTIFEAYRRTSTYVRQRASTLSAQKS